MAQDTKTFSPDSGGKNRLRYDDATWATAHNAATAEGEFAAQTIDCRFSGGVYLLDRLFMPFDTSSLPNDASVDSAFIRLVARDNSKIDDDTDAIVIVSNNQASPTSLELVDYNQLGTTSFGSITIANFNDTEGASNDFALNASGKANIDPTGWSNFGGITERDRANNAPTGVNRIWIGETEILLSVTYTYTPVGGNPMFFSTGGIAVG